MDARAFIAEINKIPPVTRFLAGSSLAVTLPVMLQFVSIYKILYHYPLVFEGLEIWRIWTSFFYSGTGINFIFDFVMMYRTSGELESQHYTRRSADYAWQLMLTSVGLLALNHPLGSHLHHRPLLLALVYISSRLSPNAQFSLFGIVTIPAKWWPYVMLGLDGAMGGRQILAQSLTGIVVGHAWWLLTWRDRAAQQGTFGRAPEWLKRFMPPPPLLAGASGPQPRAFGATRRDTETQPVRRPAGYNWGTGHRLGDS